MPSFDPDPHESRRYALRLLILALFLGWILVGHFAHAAVMVTADSPPNWNPAGSSGGSAELSELLKQPVGTGRAGYPSVPIQKKESVPAPVAKGALRGLMRAGGWAMWGLVIVELGGEFYNWLQCSTNQICKQGGQIGPDGNKVYLSGQIAYDSCRSAHPLGTRNPTGGFVKYDCELHRLNTSGNMQYAYLWGWNQYFDNGQTIPENVDVFWIINSCPSGFDNVNGSCLSSGQPLPVSDADLDNAAQALISQRPASAIDALRRAGSWDQLATKRVYPEQTNAQGNPVTTQTPDGRTKTVTPGTKAREQPAPAGSTNNSTVVYNYNTTTITNADGSTETTVTEEDAGISDLELPDDYAREDTLQEVRDALVKQPDPAPKPETATQPKQAVQTYFDLLKTVPIVDTIGGGLDRWETDFSGGGSCPTYDIPVYGTIRTMTSHCIVGESIRDFLAAVLAVIYSVSAVRIFLSA